MQLNFTKMHGLGNDFVVLDFLQQAQTLTAQQMRFIADRHFGIGCDQILVIEPSTRPDCDVLYRIYNADGGEVEQCGNGARCIAAYLREQHSFKHSEITAETQKGIIKLFNEADGNVRVDMGVPDFSPSAIGLDVASRSDEYQLALNSGNIVFHAVSMGNPHAVILLDSVDDYPVETNSPEIQQSSLFQHSVNVGYMQIVDKNHIKIRVYERGVGETLACGSGACAAMVTGRQFHGLDDIVDVELLGGTLTISWSGEGQSVSMSGPAAFVYKGTISL